MTRVETYTDALLAATRFSWRHDLVDPDGEILASTVPDRAPILWGAELDPVQVNPGRFSARTANLSVIDPDGVLMPDKPSSMLHPESGNRVRVWGGFETGSYWPQATLLPDEVDGVSDGGIASLSVYLVEPLRPLASTLTSAFRLVEGENVQNTVNRLVRQVDPVVDARGFAGTDYTTPSGSIEAGSERKRHLIELLDGVGHEIAADVWGLIYTRPIRASHDTGGSRWRYGQSDGIPIKNIRRRWSVRVPQGWRVEGGSFQNQEEPVTWTVYDTDPTSEGYWQGEGETHIPTSRLPWVRTIEQAAHAGYAQLRRSGVGPMTVTFDTLPNPAILDGDLVELEAPQVNAEGVFMVMSYSLPIQLEGLMSVTCRKVYDPEVSYVPRQSPDGCIASYADTFARADEDLQGSAWVEHGWSWGVVGQQAVQRYPDGWCMALLRNPLCSWTQSAVITVDAVPNGRKVGPVVSSSGGFDGWAAVADQYGNISIERWLGGRRVEQIGTYANGSTVAGTTLGLYATQSQLEVKIGGSSVGTWEVDDLSGTSVGMLGFGGPVGAAPAVSSFNGAPI